MPFTIDRFDQIQSIHYDLCEQSYYYLDKIVQKSCSLGFVATLIRETAVVVTSLATVIGALVEHIFKGAIHIIGTPFSEQCRFYYGFDVLTRLLILNIGTSFVKTCASVCDIPFKMVDFLSDSKNYAATRYLKIHILNLRRALETHPNSSLLEELNTATEKNSKALLSFETFSRFDLIQRAVELNDTELMLNSSLSFVRKTEKLNEQLFELHLAKANSGDLHSKYFLAYMYRAGMGTEKNLDRFIQLTKECIQQDYIPAKYMYADYLMSTQEEDNIPEAFGNYKACFEGYKHKPFAIAILAIIAEKPDFEREISDELLKEMKELCVDCDAELNQIRAWIRSCKKSNEQNIPVRRPRSNSLQ